MFTPTVKSWLQLQQTQAGALARCDRSCHQWIYSSSSALINLAVVSCAQHCSLVAWNLSFHPLITISLKYGSDLDFFFCGPIDQHFLEVSFSLLPQFPLPRAKGGPVPQTLPHCPCTATPGLALAQQLPHPQQWPSSQVGRVSWAWCQAPRLSGSHQPLTQTRAGAATRPPSRVPLSSGQLWLGGASAEAGPELPWGP